MATERPTLPVGGDAFLAEAERVRRRTAEWAETVRPVSPLECFLVSQLAVESVRVERCQAEERILLANSSDRAADPKAWDEDRRLAAEETGARLPRDPARTVRRLRQTVQGCDWLIARWEGLLRALEPGRPWTDAQRALALDLLGTPAALRDGPTPADPGPDDGLSALAPQRALASAELAALRGWRDRDLENRDEDERLAAELGGGGHLRPEIVSVRRYESACHRRFDRALRLLLAPATDRADAAPAPAPSTATTTTTPATDPSPRPGPASPPRPAPAEAPARVLTSSQHAESPSPARVGCGSGSDFELAPPRGNRRWRKARRRRSAGEVA